VMPVLAPRPALDPAVLARLPAEVARRLSRGDTHEALLEAVRRASGRDLSDERLQLSDEKLQLSDGHEGADGALTPETACEPLGGEWDLQHWDSTEAQPSSTMTVRCAREALEAAGGDAVRASGDEPAPRSGGRAKGRGGASGIPISGTLPIGVDAAGAVGNCSEDRLAEAMRRAQVPRAQTSFAERTRQRSTAAQVGGSGGRKRSWPPTARAAAPAVPLSGPPPQRRAPHSRKQSTGRAAPASGGGDQWRAAAAAAAPRRSQGADLGTLNPVRRGSGGAKVGRRLRSAGAEMYQRARQAMAAKEARCDPRATQGFGLWGRQRTISQGSGRHHMLSPFHARRLKPEPVKLDH
jgi:hypothetical protein